MTKGFSHWSGDELVRRFGVCGSVGYGGKRLGSVWYGWVRLSSVRYGSSIVCVVLTLGASAHRRLTMGEPIGQRSMRLNQDNRCHGVSPSDVCARVSQENLTLSPLTCRKPAMGEPIGRCSTRHLWENGGCQPRQPEQHPVRRT